MKAVRTFAPTALDATELAARLGSTTVSVCIPCRDEAVTIGPLVASIISDVVESAGLVDEVIVVDDGSSDDTAVHARAAGATVVHIEDVNERHGVAHGKGNALWAGLLVSTGDIVVWLDGDITSFDPSWVTRLVAPLVEHGDISLVKASSRRPTEAGGGGRTTELVARPLISLYFPDLADLVQPLAGEYAGRRTVLEELPFVTGWGVEMALLIDVANRDGASAIAQVDVGVREHRHRALTDLTVQAAEVTATVLGRVRGGFARMETTLRRPDGTTIELNLAERPPVASISETVASTRSGAGRPVVG